ncbi:MAG TPA: DUF2752 domain-containing protein [Sphingobacteriaceae bacterium]|nr:DUF2752 domain-containing protein [Sphingobacteriaceae bacterium]
MRINLFPLELICWLTALLLLAVSDIQGHHFTFCPLANMGITWCSGCGLGRSISSLLHGNVANSLHIHWLGIPALAILIYRIVSLIKNTYFHII